MNTRKIRGAKKFIRIAPIGYRRGVSLLEISLGIGLMALVAAGVTEITNEQAAAGKAASSASMLTQVQTASQEYMKANYQQLMTAAPVGANPIAIRAGRPTAGAAVPPGPSGSLTSIQGGGFLPTTFIDRDNYRFRHMLLVRQTVAGTLEGLVVQASDAELGLGSDGGTAIRDNDLGRIVARMGQAGGARFTTNAVAANAPVVQGNGGSWATKASDWSASGFTPQTGRAAATVSFGNTNLLSDYLSRYDTGIPESTTMRADLNMGITNNITAANDISSKTVTAANTVVAGAGAASNPTTMPGLSMYMANGGIACAGSASGCKFWISTDGGFTSYKDGWTRYQGTAASGGFSIEGAGNNLYVGGDSTLTGNMAVGKNGSINGTLTVNGAVGLNSSLGVQGNTAMNGRLDVLQDSSFAGNLAVNQSLGVNGTGTFGDNVGVSGDINVSTNALGAGGNIFATTGIIKGLDVASNRDLSVGRTLSVAGDSILTGYLTVDKDVGVHGALTVDGDTQLKGNAIIGANATVAGYSTSTGLTTGLGGINTGLFASPGDGCNINSAGTAAGDGTIALASSDRGLIYCSRGVWAGAGGTRGINAGSIGNGTWKNIYSTPVLVTAQGGAITISGYGSGCEVTIYIDDGVSGPIKTTEEFQTHLGNCSGVGMVPPGGSVVIASRGSVTASLWR